MMTIEVRTSGGMDLLTKFRAVVTELRRQMREIHHRHVSIGDLLTDRWETAREHGFGEGTSCYDNVLILGTVAIGKHCWIGPNVILDGTGGLTIGDHVDICAGVQIYSHDTVSRVLSGGTKPIARAPTRIGSRVYIGPQAVIQKGITIGDNVIVGAMSLVNRSIPNGAKAWGTPARPRA
jgi:acetyltransferase-like isoleucine patch superfamily enzyme